MDGSLLTLQNDVFKTFAFYGAIVLLKTMFMSIWTSKFRQSKKVYAMPEDYKTRNLTPKQTDDPDVERVRRCHRNDLENVLPFILIGLLYISTNPSATVATWYFRLFTGSRLIHTFVYLSAIPQPARGLSFFIGFVINVAMAVTVMVTCL